MATPEELHDFILERASERAARKAAELMVHGRVDMAAGPDHTAIWIMEPDGTVKIVKSGK